MDSFIDKFAQRKNAQEMIRANAMAEAEERKRMAARLSEYEQAMQEMRKCSLLNMENAEKVKEALAASLHKIEELQRREDDRPEKSVEEVHALLEKLTAQMAKFAEEQQAQMAKFAKEQQAQMTEALEKQQSRMTELSEQQTAQTKELLDERTKAIEELMHASDEFGHKEAVKVYRNVQAVLETALPKQTEDITAAMKNATEKKKTPPAMTVLWVLTFAAAAANVVIEVLKILGYL